MQIPTFLYIIIALLISVALAFFQYFYKEKRTSKITILLFVLRALALWVLSLLLINPKITTTLIQNSKPKLAVLIDNSLSIKYFQQEKTVYNTVTQLKNDATLAQKFEIHFFSFGKNTASLDSLSFLDKHTHISDALQAVNELYKDNITGVILLSDGNQTIGNDYEFTNSKQAVFPIVLGDTTYYTDVRISQLNVNKYSYIKNKFPVEALLFYEGKEPVNTQFSIRHKGQTVFTKKITFTPENNTQLINTNITSTQEGLQYYTASVKKLPNEKNTQNNSKSFSVEVIDQQAKVLILTSVVHPDLGALKKSIESTKQREVTTAIAEKFKGQLSDYQLVIFYQPTQNFKSFFQQRTSNYVVISGTHTDWGFLNSAQKNIVKKAIHQSENYQAIYNEQFLTFYQKDIDFNQFPPLQDKFGELTIQGKNQVLLHQKISNVITKAPLVVFFEEGTQKSAYILGENLWKWRFASFRKSHSFEAFDTFIGNLVQYVSASKKRKRLEVTAESMYPENTPVRITAFYTDKNYRFDNRASVQITLTHTKTKEKKTVPFSLVNNSYQVVIENLPAGNYNYKVHVNGQQSVSYGKFKITNYQIEEQFTNANREKLQKLAHKTGGELYFPTQLQKLKQNLLSNKAFYTTQKSVQKEQNLLDWQWILFVPVALLTIEWFIRKYYGKV